MQKNDQPDEVWFVLWPDSETWGRAGYRTREEAVMAFVGFFMPMDAQRHLQSYFADKYWDAYEKAGFKLRRFDIGALA